MNTTIYIHANTSDDLSIEIEQRLSGSVALGLGGKYGPHATVFLTHEQLRQMQAEIEAFLQDEALAMQEDVMRQELPA